MNKLERINRLIHNRIVGIVAHGNSLIELETKIEEFRNIDICWCGMNYFNPTEDYIIKKIGKKFEIVFDCSTVENANDYELNMRIPRLEEYLSRNLNNFFITLNANLPVIWRAVGKGEFATKFENKIIYGEHLGFDTDQFCVSLPLYLTCLTVLGARKIIIFGLDGKGTTIGCYYKPELILKDKQKANNEKFNIGGDAHNINTTFPQMLDKICKDRGISKPEIVNCSINSAVTIFKKINYEEGIKWLKNQK